MKIADIYKNIKEKYPDYIVLIKSGIFYTTLNDDALIVNRILNYNLINNKIGFPIKNIDYVIDALNKKDLNVIVDDKEYKVENSKYYYILEEVIKIANDKKKIEELYKIIDIKIKQDNNNYNLIKEYINEL